MDSATFPEKLTNLLAQNNIPYELLLHAPEGKTDLASKIRGHELREAAKAMVVLAKCDKERRYYLAIVSGDCRIDFDAIKQITRASRVTLAPVDKATELTGCVMGAVPPFSFHPELKVIVDKRLLENERLVFNAGRLDQSIFMTVNHYLAIANPSVHSIAKL